MELNARSQFDSERQGPDSQKELDLSSESLVSDKSARVALESGSGVQELFKVKSLELPLEQGSRTVKNFDAASVENVIAAELILSEEVGSAVTYAGRNVFKKVDEQQARAYRRERLEDQHEAALCTPLTPRLSENAVLFTGGTTAPLGQRLARELGVEPGDMVKDKFPNSETRIEVHESVRGKHAFVVADMREPINDSVMETALTVQALKLASADKISVVLPYFGYSRQDRKADTRPPISARAVTDILGAMGADHLVSVDLHARQVEGFFDGPFDNLEGLQQIIPHLVDQCGTQLLVVSPDEGGSKRARRFAHGLGEETGNFTPTVIMSKFRPGPDEDPKVTLTVGEEYLKGKTCVLVDDMIDTGGSIIAAASALKERGAGRVIVAATHGIFSDNAVERLESAQIDRDGGQEFLIDSVFVTDTVPLNQARSEFLQVVSLAPLLAESLVRLDTPRGTLGELNSERDLGKLLPVR